MAAVVTTATAPGRVNLIGEHTDYNDGLCLPIAIPYVTTVRATPRDDGRFRVVSAQQDGPAGAWEGTLADAGPGRVEGWAAYAAGTLWALDRAGYDVPGLDLEVDSTVPVGAGLSSSAALEAAVAAAVVGSTGRDLDAAVRRDLVAVCRRAESEVVGAPTGGLDQSAVLLTRPDSALLLDFDGADPQVVPFAPDADGLALVVVDTRVSHALTDGGYGSRREECDRAARALGVPSLRRASLDAVEELDDDVLRRRARHVVTENVRVEQAVAAIGARDWTRLGLLFSASHLSMRDDFEISCPELDLVVDTAVGAGALGARMTGGGFGGSAIALVPLERVEACRRAINTAFALAGHRPAAHLDGTPSGPATLV
ncbi:galactokinase [Nocardioides dongxiaopingii]|uniref:galactokinase n=1 Tax=Nocardioides dongxiaopingii TaxID=2576036 RepID=UPI0010C765FE